MLVIIYILFYALQFYFPGRLQEIVRRIFAYQMHDRNYGARRSDEWVAQLLIGSVSVLGFALFIMVAWSKSSRSGFSGTNEWLVLSVLCMVVLLFTLVKYGVVNLLVTAAGNDSLSEHYFLLTTSFGFIVSLVLAGLSVPAVFLTGNPLWWLGAGLGIWVLFYIVRVFKSGLIALSMSGVSAKYILLYICALEILPVAVMVKFALLRLNI